MPMPKYIPCFSRDCHLRCAVCGAPYTRVDQYSALVVDPPEGAEAYFVTCLQEGDVPRWDARLSDLCASLSPHETLGAVYQVARALGELHRSGYVHRDLSTENVLAYGHGLLVGNFGSVRPAEEAYTDLRRLRASPWAAPPELLQANGTVLWTPAADVWSLGCVALEMVLLGRTLGRPFSRASSPSRSLRAHLANIHAVLGAPSGGGGVRRLGHLTPSQCVRRMLRTLLGSCSESLLAEARRRLDFLSGVLDMTLQTDPRLRPDIAAVIRMGMSMSQVPESMLREPPQLPLACGDVCMRVQNYSREAPRASGSLGSRYV